MKEYNVDRKTAKNLFLSLAFFGSFKSWCAKKIRYFRKETNNGKLEELADQDFAWMTLQDWL